MDSGLETGGLGEKRGKGAWIKGEWYRATRDGDALLLPL